MGKGPTVFSFLMLGLALGPALAASEVGNPDVQEQRGDPHGRVGKALKPGANSFTAAQVKARLAEMGFTEVVDLAKDDQGIWRGKAMHAGKTLAVGMDYEGNVAAE